MPLQRQLADEHMPEETAELEPSMAEPEEEFQADPGLGLGGLRCYLFREVLGFFWIRFGGLGLRRLEFRV